MAIGRNFEEAIQKGSAHDRTGNARLMWRTRSWRSTISTRRCVSRRTQRVFVISKAMHKGYTVDQIHDLTKIDRWFLYKLRHIIDIDEELKRHNVNTLGKDLLREAKVYGFSDFQIATRHRTGGRVQEHAPGQPRGAQVAQELRHPAGGEADRHPAPRSIRLRPTTSTSPTPARSRTWTSRTTATPSSCSDRAPTVSVAPWSLTGVASSALQTIRRQGYRSIMVNYNPETVSTDYDMCDRLYFDELTLRARDGYLRPGASSRHDRLHGWSDPQQPCHAPRCDERAHSGYGGQGHRQCRGPCQVLADRSTERGINQPELERADEHGGHR